MVAFYSSPLFSLFLSLFIIFFTLTKTCLGGNQEVYIVYLGHHVENKTLQQIHSDHHSIIQSAKNCSEEEAKESLLYSYKNLINGFASFLSEDEASKISEMEGVVSVFRGHGRYSLHTTRSWEFMGIEEGLTSLSKINMMPEKANHGKDVIIGMLDTGVWPESKSFDDKGMGPIPTRWNGACDEGDSFNSSSCNNKLIGARYYTKFYEKLVGPLNHSYSYRSPRDSDGHGTHTASTVAGRTVLGVSDPGGFAYGNASGGATHARLAIYKVCWPIRRSNSELQSTCIESDVLNAFDDAVTDGVDVISMSIGTEGSPKRFLEDGMAIGALLAEKRGVVVVCSGGNSGPVLGTVRNLAPWMITVAARSIDRGFFAAVVLGSGKRIEGQTLTRYTLEKKMYSLVFAGDIEVPGMQSNVSGQCLANSLSPKKARNKIVLCFRGTTTRVEKGKEVKRAGGAAIIVGNRHAGEKEIPLDSHVLPGTGVQFEDAMAIWAYLNSTEEPIASICKGQTRLGIRPSPVVTDFSSRGPNRVEPNILKPDITAPGLNILAAWTESSLLSKDDQRIKFSLLSGTSMACPHVSAIAALLKSVHPDWSSAAIRSALMTTATTRNSQGGPITTLTGEVAGPLDFGSGHVRPSHAMDPGLIYDARYEDYLLFICATAGVQVEGSFPCPPNPPATYNLNYPSVAVDGVNGTVKVYRTVTNVGQQTARYQVSIKEPQGVRVHISPEVLSFRNVGEKMSFNITLTKQAKGMNGHVAGSYTWTDGLHNVTSPIVVFNV